MLSPSLLLTMQRDKLLFLILPPLLHQDLPFLYLAKGELSFLTMLAPFQANNHMMQSLVGDQESSQPRSRYEELVSFAGGGDWKQTS